MADIDYDDPDVEARWISEQKENVTQYLEKEKVKHGGVKDKPTWFVAPYVSIWEITSSVSKEKTGFWVISGDLPTDYLSTHDASDPRSAAEAFSTRWFDVSSYMVQGKKHPSISIGTEEDNKELGELLFARAKTLKRWSEDDEIW